MNVHGLNEVNRRPRPSSDNNGSAGFFGGGEGFQPVTI